MRPVYNPPNPWSSTHVEWLGEPPPARLEIFEEDCKSLIVENDSPDVGFRFGVNPYRGCQHACAYCISGDTRILMGDGRARRIAEVRVGDVVYGTVLGGKYRRFTRTTVLAHWRTEKPAYAVRLIDGTEMIASGDHRFLSDRGWKHVAPASPGETQRPYLTTNNSISGTGRFARQPDETPQYRVGYLCGMIRGDGLLGSYSYERPGRSNGDQHQFRLALADREGLDRTRRYLETSAVFTREFEFQAASGPRRAMTAIRTHARASVDRIRALVAWPLAPTDDWRRGFLAGIFDAEGSYSETVLRIANCDAQILRVTQECLRRFGFDCVLEAKNMSRCEPGRKPMFTVRVRGGLREHFRFFHTVDPAIRRKTSIEGRALKATWQLRVHSVTALGVTMPMFDITTGTGDFIAEGVVSHNCYARPSHQYLGFGAGTDFETKIVVKVNAPEVIRRELSRPSWNGDLLCFSGNTDCYQPLEASYELTRRCLEACRDAGNPVGIITKGVLVRRDAALLAEMERRGGARVHVSIPFLDPAVSRAMEPAPAAPARRFEAMRALADAGVPVGLSLAPVIPGLNDRDIPELLERAKEAGASFAFLTLVRLPGEVLFVFRERLESAFPDRAKKVWSQILDVRGGRLNDPRFGSRMEGAGPRWKAIADLFHVTCRRLGLNTDDPPAGPRRVSPDGERAFRRLAPDVVRGQHVLFES